MTRDVVAMDGPSGAGKTTVARAVAARLGYRCLETGAMYRALTLAAQEQGISSEDEQRLGRLVGELSQELELAVGDEITRVVYRGRDITERLRHPDVEEEVSLVAAHPAVRKALVALQRQMAAQGRIVMEGRDIGTVVVPEARHKFYLTAGLEERVHRRHQQLLVEGIEVDREDVRREILRRDERDASRSAGPLRPASDAETLDTTDQTVDEVVDQVLHFIAQNRHGDTGH